MIETEPTPGVLASVFTTLSSNNLYKPGMLSLAVTERTMIGISSDENLKIIGFPAASGKEDFTIASLSLISFVATSISLPYLNSHVTTEIFSLDWEVKCLR